MATICHNFFDSHLPISLNFSLCTPLAGSFIFLQTHEYFVSPLLKQKPLGNAVFLTVLHSNGILPCWHLSHSTSHALKTVLKTNLYLYTRPKWFEFLYSSFCTALFPLPLHSFSIYMCVCVCMRACVHACVRAYVHACVHVCACMHVQRI